MHTDNLKYVDTILKSSKPIGYPLIYLFWGVVVLVGFIIVEFRHEWQQAYWVSSTLIGLGISSYLGYMADKKLGQIDNDSGKAYLKHFSVMLVFIFIAIWQADYSATLLLVGMSYCLAGLYLDKIMLLSGIITLLAYIGVAQSIITSNLVLGAVISAGLFITAWASSQASTQ